MTSLFGFAILIGSIICIVGVPAMGIVLKVMSKQLCRGETD